MAYTIGPSSYKPGDFIHPPREGDVCDFHSQVESVADIVGETDSMGSEVMQVCEECRERISHHVKEYQADNAIAAKYCEIHKGMGTDVRQFRDPEEGSHGRFYDTCKDCRKKIVDAFLD